jgi:hypothetical protein
VLSAVEIFMNILAPENPALAGAVLVIYPFSSSRIALFTPLEQK